MHEPVIQVAIMKKQQICRLGFGNILLYDTMKYWSRRFGATPIAYRRGEASTAVSGIDTA